MKKTLLLFIKISRPKFWLYLAGTYLLGYVIGSDYKTDLLHFTFFFYFFFFLIPANIFLYGINDYFDEDTDKYNIRKKHEEYLIKKQETDLIKKMLYFIIIIVTIIICFQQTVFLQLLLFSFFLLAFLYSAPPVRFKSRVFFDAFSNILYILPGIFGYYQLTQQMPSVTIIISLFSWAMAMQLFSSIPDIVADRKAGLRTTAVLLGKKISLLLCFILWCIFSSILFLQKELFPLNILLFIFPLIPLFLIINPKLNIARVYKWYPYINSISGFLFFLQFYLPKPYA